MSSKEGKVKSRGDPAGTDQMIGENGRTPQWRVRQRQRYPRRGSRRSTLLSPSQGLVHIRITVWTHRKLPSIFRCRLWRGGTVLRPL